MNIRRYPPPTITQVTVPYAEVPKNNFLSVGEHNLDLLCPKEFFAPTFRSQTQRPSK